MSGFPTASITDLFRLKQGTYLRSEEMSEVRTETFPFLVYGANGVIGFASKKMYAERLPLISCRGANCGVTHFTLPNSWISNNSIACIPKDGADPAYYFYLFKDSSFSDVITGSAQPQITITNLSTKRLLVPPIAIQRRIASILSAYDDLIENNTRRIAILEEMARRIYEEWFVRFRFPGHEGVRMVESELGLVPEGWKYCPLGTLVEHHIGGGWGQEEANADFSVPAYVIRGTDIPDVRGGSLGRAPLRFHTPSNFRSRKLKARDIVFEVSGGSKDQPVGRAVMVPAELLSRTQHPVICASFCRLVRADAAQILPELLHLHFERIYANREIMQYQTQSTGITNFKFTVFLEKEIVIKPTAEVQGQFAQVLLPMLGLVERLGIKNSNLRTTRDILLPKLISGELSVENIEIAREAP